jgi:hypothetical protein
MKKSMVFIGLFLICFKSEAQITDRSQQDKVGKTINELSYSEEVVGSNLEDYMPNIKNESLLCKNIYDFLEMPDSTSQGEKWEYYKTFNIRLSKLGKIIRINTRDFLSRDFIKIKNVNVMLNMIEWEPGYKIKKGMKEYTSLDIIFAIHVYPDKAYYSLRTLHSYQEKIFCK